MSNFNKTLLVTGGAGFIGSNFVNYIYKKYPDYKILLLDALTYAGNLDNLSKEVKSSPNFQFFHGNITHTDLVNQLVSESNMVVHFAAESHVTRSIFDNYIFFETDVIGTQSVASAVVNHPVEIFVHISSSEVYGTADRAPMDEDHPLNARSPYAAAKAGADRLVYSYMKTYDVPAVILRPFNNYGPCQHLEKAIPNFIVKALLDQPISIHGTGASSRDWIFVEDTCRAVDTVLHTGSEKTIGEVINLGSGVDTDVLTIAKKVLQILGKSESLIENISERPGQVARHISSTEKSRQLLGWAPEVNLDDGLARTVEFYKNNRAWWEKNLWMHEVFGPQ